MRAVLIVDPYDPGTPFAVCVTNDDDPRIAQATTTAKAAGMKTWTGSADDLGDVLISLEIIAAERDK